MRIISGKYRGKKLITPRGLETRPTLDRIRESIFNIISQRIANARVLDLFAGTGALGLEALSRNAGFATFVDNSREACTVINKNIALLQFEHCTTVIQHDLTRAGTLARIRPKKFDLVFMDPPYRKGLIDAVLENSEFIDLLADNALVVCEHGAQENPGINISKLDITDQRKYGKTQITFLTLNNAELIL
ncbi:putative small methyltransferase [Desulforapulum autotrophicum HRM2]|uniref:Small methyltransferase n=1 Tax=Desulforapulum autotrophicum (strain ATCC 43914 / DSM 3382 / VKM B-1955 / HRM2) TaxID=177437 RepID=C0QLE1_DESAH|nr:16S rRNA (guanine(966)-N(2))-methyltransferase RsmD [Desulforapulum autotrophicum]ACN14227.1 putative small methyltransferase [Desulforapulum autotrophicum HRM2]